MLKDRGREVRKNLRVIENLIHSTGFNDLGGTRSKIAVAAGISLLQPGGPRPLRHYGSPRQCRPSGVAAVMSLAVAEASLDFSRPQKRFFLSALHPLALPRRRAGRRVSQLYIWQRPPRRSPGHYFT